MTQLDDAIEKIRTWILSGKYDTGHKLAAEELASELGMSRTPIREAFHVLASEGIVELIKGRGARVSLWTDDVLDSMFETRTRLEGLAAHRAAERITIAEVEHLLGLAERIAVYASPGPGRDLLLRQEVNQQLHSTIVKISGSSAIETALVGVVHASVLARTQQGYDDEAQARIASHHFDIVAALRAGDGEWAEYSMRGHLLAARASLLGPRRVLEAGDPADLRNCC